MLKFIRFKADFIGENSICVTKEILSKEKAEEILSKKIDFSKMMKDYEEPVPENSSFSKNTLSIQPDLSAQIDTAKIEVKQEEEEEEFKANEILFEDNEVVDKTKTEEKFQKMFVFN